MEPYIVLEAANGERDGKLIWYLIETNTILGPRNQQKCTKVISFAEVSKT
jgi:hypothetical protein